MGPGTYTAFQSIQPGHLQGLFDLVANGVTVKSTSGAGNTILVGSTATGTSGYPAVRVQANNAVLDGFTIQGSNLAVYVINQSVSTPTPITGVVLRNLVLNPLAASSFIAGGGIRWTTRVTP